MNLGLAHQEVSAVVSLFLGSLLLVASWGVNASVQIVMLVKNLFLRPSVGTHIYNSLSDDLHFHAGWKRLITRSQSPSLESLIKTLPSQDARPFIAKISIIKHHN